MARTKISEFSATPANNTDIDSINIAEGCAPSGINDAIRELMAQLKDFQTGAVGDSFNGPVGTSTAAAGAFTTLSSTGNTTLGDASGDAVTINGTATFANANPTLTAGTANGVTYLNGSKVLTSGSALVFDGTNLGLGSSTINTYYDRTQQIYGTASSSLKLTNATAGTANTDGFDVAFNGTTGLIYNRENGDIAFGVNNTEGMRLTSTGLGIGTSSPTQKLDVYGNGMKVNNASYVGYLGAGNTFAGGAASDFCVRSDNVLSFATNGPYERARIESSGNLLVGKTSSDTTVVGAALLPNATAGFIAAFTSDGQRAVIANRLTSDGTLYSMRRSGTEVGTIAVTTVLTTYNTTSDYRLKTVVGAVTNHGERIDALQPVEYTWNSNGTRTRGFLAHQFQEVYAGSVTGDKDAVDADGNPVYQSMQASSAEVIADLVAEIQSLRQRLSAANL